MTRIMKNSIKTIGLAAALAMVLTRPLFSQVPDLTKDLQSVDRKLTYNLGATGLRGWIYTRAANNLDAAQGRTTLASRQILVTHVGAASPCRWGREGGRCDPGGGWQTVRDDARKSHRGGHSGSGNGGPGRGAQAEGLARRTSAGSRAEARRDGLLQ
jgi:hypothetical protein